MRWELIIALAATVAFVSACKSDSKDDTMQPVPFPVGPEWDYPVPAAELEAEVARGDETRLRRHGWYLFAGVNMPTERGLPIWRTWPTATHAYAPDPAAVGAPGAAERRPGRSLIQLNADNIPVNIRALPNYLVPESICARFEEYDCPGTPEEPFFLPDGVAFQNNGNILIAGVIYNQAAFEWLRTGYGGQGLFQAATLTGLLPPEGETTEIDEFPEGSIVLKHMYWPVKGDRCSPLPVWDNPTPPTPGAYMGYEVWERAVAIATDGCAVEPGGTTEVRLLHGVLDGQNEPMPTRTFANAKVVPLDALYHQTFTQADLDALDRHDRALLDATSMWAHGAPFTAGDSIASIALHIFTKEMPGWTMQSFWWHDQPDLGPYSTDRPDIPQAQAPTTWRNYLMTIEYGVPTSGDPSLLPVRYNPYIELVIHPVETNCRNCHRRAAWPRWNSGITPYARYQVRPIEEDPGLLANIGPDATIFRDLLLLDFQWSLSDRASPRDGYIPANARRSRGRELEMERGARTVGGRVAPDGPDAHGHQNSTGGE